MKKIQLLGTGQLFISIHKQLSQDYEVICSSELCSEVLCIVSAHDEKCLEEEMDLQRKAKGMKIPYLRTTLDQGMGIIGPWVDLEEGIGCISCADRQVVLLRLQQRDQTLAPFFITAVENLSIIVKEEIDKLYHQEPLSFLRNIYIAQDEGCQSQIYPIPDTLKCRYCQPKQDFYIQNIEQEAKRPNLAIVMEREYLNVPKLPKDSFEDWRKRENFILKWAKKTKYRAFHHQWVKCLETGKRQYILQPMQSRLGVGKTKEEAIKDGILKVVREDTFSLYWFNRQPPIRFTIESLNSKKATLMQERLHLLGVRVHTFFLLNESRIPVVWVILENQRNPLRPCSINCARAAMTLEDATYQGLVEAEQLFKEFESLLPYWQKRILALVEDEELLTQPEDHILLYSHPSTWGRLKRNLSFCLETNASSLCLELGLFGDLIKYTLCLYPEIYYQEVPELSSDYKVVQLGIPNLQLLEHGTESGVYSERFFQIPHTLGWMMDAEEAARPSDPHPLYY